MMKQKHYITYTSNTIIFAYIDLYKFIHILTIKKDLFIFLKKVLFFSFLRENFLLYLRFFIRDFNISENKFFKEKLDFSLNQLILNIFYDIKNINFLIFFIPGYITFVFLGNKDIIFIYLSYFLFSISFFIKLVFILRKLINNKLELTHPLIFNIIKYILFGLLFINI